MQENGCLLCETSNFYYQFTLKDMIYLLIFIVLIVGVLLHSFTSTETSVSDEMTEDEWDQVMSSDSGE